MDDPGAVRARQAVGQLGAQVEQLGMGSGPRERRRLRVSPSTYSITT